MIRGLVRLALPVAAALIAGAALGYLTAAGRWSWSPVVLATALSVVIGWWLWGEATLPREPLGDDQAELKRWVAMLAADAGLTLRGVAVVEAPAGEFDPGETPARLGEVVFAHGDLERHSLSGLLALAARQVAWAQAPPRYPWPGALAVGVMLGLLLGWRDRLGGTPGAVAALAGLLLLYALVSWRTVTYADRRVDAARRRAAELLGRLRDAHPEAFADLAERQGLPPSTPS